MYLNLKIITYVVDNFNCERNPTYFDLKAHFSSTTGACMPD